jgi:glycosyltransferase involved in cell wall biosynthesis
MRCPRLSDLPAPSYGKSGWPWTEESQHLNQTLPNYLPWPRITIVTPSYNQGKFIEETIRSILLQGYPDLEYLILDGGSVDNSVEIIQKYSPWLTYWVSERDGGQSNAINRGLRLGSGSYATWINSDDLLCRNALLEHAAKIGFGKNIVYVGICGYLDEQGKINSFHSGKIQSLKELLQIRTIWHHGGAIDQPAVLFPRDLALSVGGLDPDNHISMDYELWGKFFLAGASFQNTGVHFGIFRQHSDQKTCDMLSATESMLTAAAKLVRTAACFSEEQKAVILAELDDYGRWYKREHWRRSGRLASLGLSPIIVTPVRKIRAKLRECLKSYVW